MKDSLIPIPVSKEQIMEQLQNDITGFIGENIKFEKFSIEIDHLEWTSEGVTVYARIPTSRSNKK